MKTVIVSVVGLLLAIGVQAQNTCPKVPTYDENIVPTCTAEFYNKGIRLPNYANVQSYYTCPTSTTKTGVLSTCPSSTPYFSLTYQSCNTCDDYLPAVKCSGLNLGLECVPISSTGTTAAPTTTTQAPGEVTTKTTKSTAAPTTTTTAMPGPPVDSSTTTNNPGGETSGTTVYVPQPPSPNEGPTPPGPDPTVPNLPSGPPEIQ